LNFKPKYPPLFREEPERQRLYGHIYLKAFEEETF